MNLKKILLYSALLMFLLFISETINFLSNPASQGSAVLNKYFINQAISNAKANNFNKSMFYLSIASRVNIFGEYDHYRKLLPGGYLAHPVLPEDEALKTLFISYLSGLTEKDLKNSEDQGLGRIYYHLALIAYKNNHTELTPILLKIASYNNPQFASFHAELINYYFSKDETVSVSREMDYCFEFEEARTLCGQYRDDSLRLNTPKDIGYMGDEVEKHYLQ